MPTVSVIIPAYNQGHYLGECVRSVLNQTHQDFEAIIIDDGSTDNTREVANSFDDSRIRYIYQENRGLSGARNTGIRNATGLYISYLDSDDQFLPNKLELLITKLEGEPDLGFAAGQAILIDEHGDEIGQIFDNPLPADPSNLLLGNPLHVGSVILTREWQDRAGFFDKDLRSYEDWDMWLRLAKLGCKMAWVPEPVSLYRFHSEQMTKDGSQMTNATFAVLEKIYSDPDIPESWRTKKDLAYSNAYLRAAPQAYRSGFFDKAKTYMDKAVTLNPAFKTDHGEQLAKRISGWADYGKADDPLHYMRDIYNHLPDSLSELGKRRNLELANKAVDVAFRTYNRGNLSNSRQAILFGLRHQPSLITNRGVLSILIRSFLHINKN
jgi:glycosyltransferase involved in cell wall biosynthesis